jgi:hypothetical protein
MNQTLEYKLKHGMFLTPSERATIAKELERRRQTNNSTDDDAVTQFINGSTSTMIDMAINYDPSPSPSYDSGSSFDGGDAGGGGASSDW